MQLFPDEENQFCHGSFIYAAGHCIFESHKVDPLLLSIFQVVNWTENEKSNKRNKKELLGKGNEDEREPFFIFTNNII